MEKWLEKIEKRAQRQGARMRRLLEKGKEPKRLTEKDPIPTLSIVCSDRLWLDREGCPYNTPLAERYHKKLKKELGLDVVACTAQMVQGQLGIRLWTTRKEDTYGNVKRAVFHAKRGDEIFEGAPRCLCEALEEIGVGLPQKERILSGLPGKGGIPRLWVSVISFEWMLYTDVLGKARYDIDRLFRRRFAYWDVYCECASLEFRYETIDHIFMFRCANDIERAKRDGIYEKLFDEAYKLVQKYDVRGLIPRKAYRPAVVSTDQFGGEALFNIARG